jgi:DeoR-like protein with HTH domain
VGPPPDPLRPDIYISDTRRGRKLERFRLFVDSYGMDDSDRLKVVEGVQLNYMWFYHLIKSNAASGHAVFAKLWAFKTLPRAKLTIQWHAENNADVTTETSRRDLPFHEGMGVLRRVHGSAIPMERLRL